MRRRMARGWRTVDTILAQYMVLVPKLLVLKSYFYWLESLGV
jgi:hypothetical protein